MTQGAADDGNENRDATVRSGGVLLCMIVLEDDRAHWWLADCPAGDKWSLRRETDVRSASSEADCINISVMKSVLEVGNFGENIFLMKHGKIMLN